MKKFLALFCLSFVISACGFKPLYVDKTSEGGWYFDGDFDSYINSEMEKVKIETIPERFGQQLRNDLIDIVTPKGVPENAKYKLHVDLVEQNVQRQALRKDITATRERVMYKVVYYMTEGVEELFRGDSIAYASYDIMANPYSTTMAQKQAERDATRIIANDISLRIGAYFHAKKTKGINQ